MFCFCVDNPFICGSPTHSDDPKTNFNYFLYNHYFERQLFDDLAAESVAFNEKIIVIYAIWKFACKGTACRDILENGEIYYECVEYRHVIANDFLNSLKRAVKRKYIKKWYDENYTSRLWNGVPLICNPDAVNEIDVVTNQFVEKFEKKYCTHDYVYTFFIPVDHLDDRMWDKLKSKRAVFDQLCNNIRMTGDKMIRRIQTSQPILLAPRTHHDTSGTSF